VDCDRILNDLLDELRWARRRDALTRGAVLRDAIAYRLSELELRR